MAEITRTILYSPYTDYREAVFFFFLIGIAEKLFPNRKAKRPNKDNYLWILGEEIYPKLYFDFKLVLY